MRVHKLVPISSRAGMNARISVSIIANGSVIIINAQ
jgi:hypothetical protein